MIDLSSGGKVAEHCPSVKTVSARYCYAHETKSSLMSKVLFAQEGLKRIWRDIPGVPDHYGRQESV